MKFSKCLLLGVAMVGVLFAGCSKAPGAGSGNLADVIPADAQLVFSINHTGAQKSDLEGVIAKFPETQLKQQFLDEFQSEFTEEDFELFNALVEGLSDDWKMYVGFAGEDLTAFLNTGDMTGVDIYFALQSEFVVQQLDELTAKAAGEDDTSQIAWDTKNGVQYADNTEEQMYLAKYEDILIMTSAMEARTEAVDRLFNGGGYDFAGHDENLAYAHMTSDLWGAQYVDMGMMTEEQADQADLDLWVSADDGGFVLESSMLSGEAMEVAFGVDTDYDLGLVNKVIGKGLMGYTEMSSFKPFMDGFAIGVMTELSGGVALSAEDLEAGKAQAAETLGQYVGLSGDQVMELIDSPVAFAAYDVGQLYPGFAIYLQVDEAQAEDAKALVQGLDRYLGEVLTEFDKQMAEQGGFEGLVREDVELVKGGAFHKIALDWSAFSDEQLAGINTVPGYDLTENIFVEFYYGFTGDNVLVFALYPEFDTMYGESSVAENEMFEKALDKLDVEDGYSVSFFAFEPLMDIVDRWWNLFDTMGLATGAEAEIYLDIKNTINTFGYFVGQNYIDDATMKQKNYLSVGE